MDDLSLSLLDICMNAIEADATTIKATLDYRPGERCLAMWVEDNGTGMDEDTARRAADPFFTKRPTRRVGLGLSFLKHASTNTGGSFQIRTTPGQGTEVKAVFRSDHVDMPNIGDIPESILTFASHPKTHDFTFVYRHADDRFVFDLGEVLSMMDKEEMNQGPIRRYLYDMLEEGITLKKGEYHEDFEGIKGIAR